MTRQLEFQSVPNSYNGEVLILDVNTVITPYEAYVQVNTDRSVAIIDLPDAVPEAIDPLVGQVVALHARSQLQQYRDEALEALRILKRMAEQLRGLDLLIARYRKSSEYNDTYSDRILQAVTGLIRDMVSWLEIRAG